MKRIPILLFILLSLEAFAVELPEGWRLPAEKEISGEERDNKHNSYISGKTGVRSQLFQIDEVYLNPENEKKKAA